MAQGDVHVFDAFLENVFDSGIHDFGASPNTFKCALIKSAANGGDDPAITDAVPCWGAGGTTNFATAQVTVGGIYTTGGLSLGTASATLSGGVLQLDFSTDPSWVSDPANPTNARWGIIYDDTATNKNCVGYVDLGADFNMTTGDLQITWGTPFATLNQA